MKDIIEASKGRLTRIERFQIRLVRRSFEPGRVRSIIEWLQRTIGATWMTLAVSRIAHFHHLDRLPEMPPGNSYILVANHRSFFDMFLVISELVQRKIVSQRIFFPVRSEFFYDNLLGVVINGVFSFFSMYPPVFRDKQRFNEKERATINVASLDEMISLLDSGGTVLGIHPEGTRNQGDPYQLLPFRSGVGRVIHGSRATVIPVFINGLETSNIFRQLAGNLLGSGQEIHVVFGEPIEFGELLDCPRSPKLFQTIADRTHDVLSALAQEERAIREARTQQRQAT